MRKKILKGQYGLQFNNNWSSSIFPNTYMGGGLDYGISKPNSPAMTAQFGAGTTQAQNLGLASIGQSTKVGGTGAMPTTLSGGTGSPISMAQVGQAADMIGNMFPPATNDPTTNAINAGVSTISDSLMQIPGFGQVLGGLLKGASAVNKGLAEFTDGKSTINNAQTLSDKILSSDLFALTGLGFANTVTKKTVEGSNKDIKKDIDMGYQATPDVETADFGGFSRLFAGKKVKQYQNSVKRTDTENALKASVIAKAKKDTIAAQNYTQDVARKNKQQILGGLNTNILSAKQGAKLERLTEFKRYLKEGGKMNVIPNGALHARKNNMDLEGDVTHKGIPVVTYKEGEMEQHAEIEREEIIFHKEITMKLEELLKDFNNGNEQAAVEAGKLLTYEILENTEDNVGLLN